MSNINVRNRVLVVEILYFFIGSKIVVAVDFTLLLFLPATLNAGHIKLQLTIQLCVLSAVLFRWYVLLAT